MAGQRQWDQRFEAVHLLCALRLRHPLVLTLVPAVCKLHARYHCIRLFSHFLHFLLTGSKFQKHLSD